MGANAQTSVPAFTAGQVLTAQQQTEINTGVPVFANTTTRDAAFGGTGEKVLAEGQLAYIEATNVVQYYDGTSWATLAPTASALTYISGASFTAASTVSMPASTFTSTYLNYRVFINITASSAAQALSMRVNAGGTAQTGANYFQARYNVTGTATVSDSAGTSADINRVRSANVFGSNVIDVFQPADSSMVTAWTYIGNGENAAGNSTPTVGGGFYNVAATHDGLTFLVSGTITGSYKVYGYANS